jgi:hypothetical protein
MADVKASGIGHLQPSNDLTSIGKDLTSVFLGLSQSPENPVAMSTAGYANSAGI